MVSTLSEKYFTFYKEKSLFISDVERLPPGFMPRNSFKIKRENGEILQCGFYQVCKDVQHKIQYWKFSVTGFKYEIIIFNLKHHMTIKG